MHKSSTLVVPEARGNSPPCRGDHGREWPLGQAQASSPVRRPSARRGSGAYRGEVLRRPRHRVPYPVRIQLRKLAPAGRRGRPAHGTLYRRPDQGSGEDAPQRRAVACDRGSRPVRHPHPDPDSGSRADDRRQRAAYADNRRQLWRAMGHAAGPQQAGEGASRGGGRGDCRSRIGALSVDVLMRPNRTCSSAREANIA